MATQKKTKKWFSKPIYYPLKQVKSIVECCNGSILQYFRPSLCDYVGSFLLQLKYDSLHLGTCSSHLGLSKLTFPKKSLRNTIRVPNSLNWVQTVCKCFQQTTKLPLATKELSHDKAKKILWKACYNYRDVTKNFAKETLP